jgi:hypothetical protein
MDSTQATTGLSHRVAPPGDRRRPGQLQPSAGAAWSHAEYAEETLREVSEGKKPLLIRIWRAVRRGIWGE